LSKNNQIDTLIWSSDENKNLAVDDKLSAETQIITIQCLFIVSLNWL